MTLSAFVASLIVLEKVRHCSRSLSRLAISPQAQLPDAVAFRDGLVMDDIRGISQNRTTDPTIEVSLYSWYSCWSYSLLTDFEHILTTLNINIWKTVKITKRILDSTTLYIVKHTWIVLIRICFDSWLVWASVVDALVYIYLNAPLPLGVEHEGNTARKSLNCGQLGSDLSDWQISPTKFVRILNETTFPFVGVNSAMMLNSCQFPLLTRLLILKRMH